MTLRTFIVALALLASVSLAASSNFPKTFNCDKVWTGPSANNDVMECAQKQDVSLWQYGLVVIAIPAVMLGFLILFYPPFFFLRQCCNLCGGRHRQPGYCCTRNPKLWDEQDKEGRVKKTTENAAYSDEQICRVRVFAFLTFMGTVFVLVFMVNSVSELRTAATDLWEKFLDQTLLYFLDQYDELQLTLASRVENGRAVEYIPPITFDTLRDVDNFMGIFRQVSKSYNEDYKDVVTVQVRIALTVFAVLPFLFIMLTPLYASLNRCLSFWPACTTCVYFFLGILYSLVAILFFTVGLLTNSMCGEVEAYHAQEPGIMNWYVIPQCEQARVFDSFGTSLNSAQGLYATEYCKALTTICDSTPAYNPLTPKLVYVCDWDNSTASSRCPNFSDATVAGNSLTAKVGAQPCGSNPSGCNVTVCASNCTDSGVQHAASDAAIQLSRSNKFRLAYVIIQPWLNCGSVVSRGIIAMTENCQQVSDTTWKVGIASVVGTFLFCVGIVILFKGQKLFFKKSADREQRAPTDGHSPTRNDNEQENREWYEPSSQQV